MSASVPSVPSSLLSPTYSKILRLVRRAVIRYVVWSPSGAVVPDVAAEFGCDRTRIKSFSRR
eukprot:6010534-Pyramimonas_sp.AAC.1